MCPVAEGGDLNAHNDDNLWTVLMVAAATGPSMLSPSSSASC